MSSATTLPAVNRNNKTQFGNTWPIMSKSRAEIQKAYRDRKKQNDMTYMEKERLRQTKYRVPVGMLTKAKLKARRFIDKEYSTRYRLKKQKRKQAVANAVNVVEPTSSHGSLQSSDSTQSAEVTSTSESVTSSTLKSPQTRSRGTNRLLVQLPFPVRSPTCMRRSKALARARNEICKLKSQLETHQKSSRRFQKRYERLLKRKNKMVPGCTSDNKEVLTPKSKTLHDIKKSGISPRSLPKSVVRQLQIGNSLVSEIRAAHMENTSQKQRSFVNTVVSGRIVKKYRCIRYLTKATGITRHEFSVTGGKKLLITSKRQRLTHLKMELQNQITSFLEKDEISRCMPGKRDVTKSNGEKKQTRILNDYLGNTHERFLADYPDVKISYSAFCKMRPKHIQVTSLLSRNKCLCTKHQNMALKLKCLSSLGIKTSPNPEVVGRSVSLDDMKDMLTGVQDDVPVEYEEWRSVEVGGKKKMRIVKVSQSKDQFIQMMLQQYQMFLEHIARVADQYKSLHELKLNLPEDHIIIQMDFAENFLCQTNDEIQSAYWNATAATIHPVVIYHKSMQGACEHTNLAFVSDVNHHNPSAVLAILKKLVPHVHSKFSKAKVIHYWTDSPSSQYRNRFIFTIISQHFELFGIEARWNYFEAGHGKGPCDGIGGTCKRMAAQAIKQGKTTIQDGRDFYQWARQNEKSIEYQFYTQEDYDEATLYLSKMTTKPLKGTMKLHAVKTTGDGKISIRDTSCYCLGCLHWSTPCQGWTERSLVEPVKTINDVESDHEIIQPSSTDDAPESDNVVPNNLEIVPPFIPTVGEFVAATYDNHWYVGRVLEVDATDSDALITFMSKHDASGKTHLQWPSKPDEIWIPFSKIIMSVSEPLPVGRSKRYSTLSTEDFESILQFVNTK